MKEKTSNLFIVFAIFLTIFGIIFLGIGFHKILVYENSDYSWGEHKNSYVGGDAYNYIINGTYFSGYCAISGALFVCVNINVIYGLKLKMESQQNQPNLDSSLSTAEDVI